MTQRSWPFWLTLATIVVLLLALTSCTEAQTRNVEEAFGLPPGTLAAEDAHRWWCTTTDPAAKLHAAGVDVLAAAAGERPAPCPLPDGWVDLGHGVAGPRGFLALRRCESTDNYANVSASGTYRGAYQFARSTWDGLAGQTRPDLAGIDPATAAPADQDAMAVALWQRDGRSPWPVCGRHLP